MGQNPFFNFYMKWLQQNKLIVLLAIIKFIFPLFVVNPVWELHRDEYLYYQQGLHLSFGFLECPPLLGLMATLSHLAGGSELVIKFWPALFGSLTLILTTLITKELGGASFARIIAALGILFSGYMRVHYLFQPNFLDIFFWALSAYFLLKYLNTQHSKYLYLLSIAFALGWWSKYSVLFFVAAMVIAILLTKNRTIFKQRAFWGALATGIILVLPNLLWQYFHRFPVIRHMEELRETQLRYISGATFLKEQVLMLLPVFFVWLAGVFWLLTDSKYRVIAFVYFAVILLLMAGSGKSYYSLGAYPMLLAAGGVWIERISKNKAWIRIMVIALILLLSLTLIPFLLPVQAPAVMKAFNEKYKIKEIGLLRWEDLEDHFLQQDFADMLGWKELAQKATEFYRSLPAGEQNDCIIYCRNYGQAGALKYYAKDAVFRSKVICDNGTFLLWIPAGINFRHLIFIGHNKPGKDDEVFNHFEKVTIVDSVTNALSRQYRDKIIFYHNADSVAVKLAKDALSEMKHAYNH